jgi:hypothetical protein
MEYNIHKTFIENAVGSEVISGRDPRIMYLKLSEIFLIYKKNVLLIARLRFTGFCPFLSPLICCQLIFSGQNCLIRHQREQRTVRYCCHLP